MNILLGVGGGIAAYKAAELARLLMEHDHTVQVVMTAAAQEFIRPLTFAALTGRKVITSLFGPSPEETLSSAVEHIRVAQESHLLLVAPATADLLAKFATGSADDFLSTAYLAFAGPIVLAPAMNTNMWMNPATQENVQTLRQRGCHMVEPESGFLACGMTGPGRLADPARIVEAVQTCLFPRRDLEGECVVVTAGPTQEPLDPVRFISNRSSGKMGYALAAAAAQRGAQVELVSGPVHLPVPAGVHCTYVGTAREMRDAVMGLLDNATIIVKAAAVADYHVESVPSQKIKKTAARMSLQLDPTPDILAELGREKGDRLLIGFAAETENLVREGQRKLQAKNCDMIVANSVADGSTFDADDNEVVLITCTGETIPVRRAPKREIANRIFDEAIKLRLALHSSRR